MSQVPLIFRKHVVARSQPSVLFPFVIVPLTRMRPCPNATVIAYGDREIANLVAERTLVHRKSV